MIGKCKTLPCTSPAATLSHVSGEGKKGKRREENCKITFVLCRAVSKQCGQSETELPWNKILESLRLERFPKVIEFNHNSINIVISTLFVSLPTVLPAVC